MSWGDFFLPSGAQSSEDAAANLAAQEDRLRAQTAAREAAGTISAEEAARNNELANQTIDSTSWGATVGALQGSVELITDPQAWAQDTKTGAGMVGSGISSVLDFGFSTMWAFFRKLGWKFWLLVLLVLFLWLDGPVFLRVFLKGKMKKLAK